MHEQLLEKVREYFFVGGMPEAVQQFSLQKNYGTEKTLINYLSSAEQSENSLVQSVINFYEKHKDRDPSCFSRKLLKGHFTSSALVVRIKDEVWETLLTHHAKLDIWIQLGGHADGDSDLLKGAKKEVTEEAGIDT